MNGDREALYILARRTLLDVLEILGAHRDAVILVGAQAIYLHVGEADMAVAVMTKDADLALDPRRLMPEPKIEEALRKAGLDSPPNQIGIWRDRQGGQVDFLVPEAFAGAKGRRAAKLTTQGSTLARRTKGLEGTIVLWRSSPKKLTTAGTRSRSPVPEHSWSLNSTRSVNARSIQVGWMLRMHLTYSAYSAAFPPRS